MEVSNVLTSALFNASLFSDSSTKKKKKKSDHVSKESKKDAKEITEKKKPEKKKLPEAIRKKIRTELKDEKLPAGKYTSIYKAVEESENKLASFFDSLET